MRVPSITNSANRIVSVAINSTRKSEPKAIANAAKKSAESMDLNKMVHKKMGTISFTKPDGTKVHISYNPYDKQGDPVSMKDVMHGYEVMRKAPVKAIYGDKNPLPF